MNAEPVLAKENKETVFPELPLEEWRPTKNTLHLYLQIVGKIRLAMHPRLNHWWHVPLYVSSRGLTTRAIPYRRGNFEIEFDFVKHRLRISTSDGEKRDFKLKDGLSVAKFYRKLFKDLHKLGIDPEIRAVPYEAPSTTPFPDDEENNSYDKKAIERFYRSLVLIDDIFEEFRGRFIGKSTPVHVFWHSFDIALTRFSGRPAPVRDGAGMVEREAYSHEVVSFGFWWGDDRIPAPAFYSYVVPEPPGLANERLTPEVARWQESGGGHLALLMYEDAIATEDPRETILEFLESAYQTEAKMAGWDVDAFALKSLK
jgi:hypothetical protein